MSYEPFSRIISLALANRGKLADDMHYSPEHRVPRYVVRLCESLAKAINNSLGSPVTVADVLRLEGTCTGTDYAQKLALRCHRLATG